MFVDTSAAIERLMRFLAIEGVTGREALIGRDIAAALQQAGVPERAIRLDDANKRIPLPTETGNLIVDLPGSGAPDARADPRFGQSTAMAVCPGRFTGAKATIMAASRRMRTAAGCA